MLALVEGTLGRTGPGSVFTGNVMAAIPMASASAGKTAALAAATTAKGMLVATKATGALGVLNILLGPLIGILAGALGVESGLKAFSARYTEFPQTAEERQAAREARKALRLEWREKMKARRKVSWAHVGQSWRGWRAYAKPMFLSCAITALLFVFVSVLPEKKGENPFLDSHKGVVLGIGLVLTGLALGCVWWYSRAFQAYYKGLGDSFNEQHRAIRKRGLKAWVMLGVLSLGVAVMAWVPVLYLRDNPALVTGVALGLVLGAGRLMRGFRKLVKWQNPDYPGEALVEKSSPGREYRSPWTFLGLPLLHIHTGRTPEGKRAEARGWIAVGDRAMGVVAVGQTAFGVVSIGPAAVGLLAIGGIAIAPLAIGCVAIGYWAAGGIALGMLATGGLALGWEAASGTFAVAQNAAYGDIAYGAHANDAVAQAVVTAGFFPAINYTLQAGLVAGLFTALFGFATFLIAHCSAFMATKEERAQTGRQVESKEIISHALGLPAIYSLALAAMSIKYLAQHWSHFELLPFGKMGVAAIGLGLLYLAAVFLGLFTVAIWCEIKKSLKEKKSPRQNATTMAFLIATIILGGTVFVYEPKSDFYEALLVISLGVCALTHAVLEARQETTESKTKAGWRAGGELAGLLAWCIGIGALSDSFRLVTSLVIIAAVLALRFAGAKMGINNTQRWKYALKAVQFSIFAFFISWMVDQPFNMFYVLVAFVGIPVAIALLFRDKCKEINAAEKAAKAEALPEKQ